MGSLPVSSDSEFVGKYGRASGSCSFMLECADDQIVPNFQCMMKEPLTNLTFDIVIHFINLYLIRCSP